MRNRFPKKLLSNFVATRDPLSRSRGFGTAAPEALQHSEITEGTQQRAGYKAGLLVGTLLEVGRCN